MIRTGKMQVIEDGAHEIFNVVVAVACVVLIRVLKEGNGEVKVTLDGVVHFGM